MWLNERFSVVDENKCQSDDVVYCKDLYIRQWFCWLCLDKKYCYMKYILIVFIWWYQK